MDLTVFAAEVGAEGPVVAVGGRTQWCAGGPVDAAAREVRAPAGVLEVRPEEMVVRCGAGTTVEALDEALAEVGQEVALDPPEPERATVGGVLAVGRSGLRRLRLGPVRDALLQARYVDARGRIVTAGGPTVKNATGYDLCRLLVGSLGTIGLLAEVLLRTRPRPASASWLAGPADPFALRRRLHRPASLLWDGTSTWVLVEGHPEDVAAQAAVAGELGLAPVEGPPELPGAGRWSVDPATVRDLPGLGVPFVAEVGVGVVHAAAPAPADEVDPVALDLHRRVKAAFDPEGRLAPGRLPYVR